MEEQSSHSPHVFQVQLTEFMKMNCQLMCCSKNNDKELPGQGILPLQVRVSVSFPVQLAPPYKAGTFVLILSWVPPLQVAEQVSHVPHSFRVQLTRLKKILINVFLQNYEAVPGQGLALQVWVSVSFMAFGSVLFPPQAAPPF